MGTESLNQIIEIVMWIVRLIILASAIPCLPKLATAKAEEDERQFSKSLITLIVIVVIFIASFPLGNIIKTNITNTVPQATASVVETYDEII